MIVVTGATGHLGRLVIAALLKKVPPSGIIAAGNILGSDLYGLLPKSLFTLRQAQGERYGI
jgi:uncharacterized protein YbjT (DUF2867 family)